MLHWLEPGSEDLNDKMPGDLTGVSLSGEYKALESYGMLAVEPRSFLVRDEELRAVGARSSVGH